MQQISLLQRVTKNEMEDKMNGLKSNMEGLKDGLKEDMEGLKDGLKEDVEGLKEGLTKLLQEMLPHGEKILDETHNEKKINVCHDFIVFDVGLKTHHISKV